MDLARRLSENRDAFQEEGRGKWWHRYLSAAEYQIDFAVRSRLPRVVSGRFLDAGCGLMPYRSLVEGIATEYIALDVEQRGEEDVVLADIQSMPQLQSGSFDTILCSEVLEHIPRPHHAMAELSRLLRPGGVLLATAPHLSRIHEAPHDYQRFTRYGLRSLAEDNGLDLIEVTEIGSVFSFLAHQVSTATVVACWHLPVIRWVVFALVTLLVTLPALLLDRLPGMRKLLPLGNVVLASRPA